MRTSHKNHTRSPISHLKTIETPVSTHLVSTVPPSELPLVNMTNDHSNNNTHNNNASWPHPTALLDYFNVSRTNSKETNEKTLLNMTLPHFPSNYSFYLPDNSTFLHTNQTKRHRKLFFFDFFLQNQHRIIKYSKIISKKKYYAKESNQLFVSFICFI
jgi:hypothetical protein